MERNTLNTGYSDTPFDATQAIPGEFIDDIDVIGIHLADIGKREVDKGANFRCGEQILEGQFSILKLARLRDELDLTQGQMAKVTAILERPAIKGLGAGFLRRFHKEDMNPNMRESHEHFMDSAVEQSAYIDDEIAYIKELPKSKKNRVIGEKINAEVVVCRDAESAWEELVERNLRLGVSVAKKYSNTVPLLDRCQAAYEGIMEAATMYDHQSGYQFTTFAINWARRGVSRLIYKDGSTIRVPIQARRELGSSLQAIEERTQEMGRNLTTDEIKECMGDSAKTVKLVMRTENIRSLDKPVYSDDWDEASLAEVVPSHDADVESQAVDFVAQAKIMVALGDLSPNERRVIELRFGIADGRERTLKEIGTEFGFTRERARQIEAKALERLRSHKILDGFDC